MQNEEEVGKVHDGIAAPLNGVVVGVTGLTKTALSGLF